MRNKKLLLVFCFFLLVFTIAACGRRGDPIAITPYKVGIDLPTGQAGSYRETGFVNIEGLPSKEIEVATGTPWN